MFNVSKDIIEYAKNWKILKGYEGFLTNEQIAEFVGDLQDQVSLMDFSLPEGTTIIGYSGISNNVKAYEIVDLVTEELGTEAVYITNLPAGGLLSGDTRVALEKTITDYITYNKEATSMIMVNGR